jgi:xylulokinase
LKHFIGLDLGTQSMKGILLNPEGELVASESVSYTPDYPQPNWAEHDVGDWIEALRTIIGGLISKSGIQAKEIGMLGLASQCGGIVPVGKNGESLRPCIIWLDRRAEPQCAKLKEKISEDEAFYIAGSAITSTLGAPKIMWIRDNEPEIYEKAVAFLEPGEYMVYYLTGELVADYAHASITMLFDVSKKEWSKKLADAAGLDLGRMYRIAAAADIAGTVKKNVAQYLGLDEGTRVVVGSGDQHAGSIGAGLTGPGKILNIMGTSEIIAGASTKPVYDETRLLKTHLHVDPTLWQIEQGALISGACVRWYVDNLARMSYSEMNEAASKAPPGSNGLIFLPALSGANSPVANGYARGIFFGLTMSHTLDYLTRSVYEGCSYAFRDNIERLDALDMAGDEIIAMGGGTNSELWMQIKSDLTGRPIRTVQNPEPTALGAAMLAGVAQKNFANFKEAADKLLKYGRVYEPNLALKPLYDEMYSFYRELFFNSGVLFDKYKNFPINP